MIQNKATAVGSGWINVFCLLETEGILKDRHFYYFYFSKLHIFINNYTIVFNNHIMNQFEQYFVAYSSGPPTVIS